MNSTQLQLDRTRQDLIGETPLIQPVLLWGKKEADLTHAAKFPPIPLIHLLVTPQGCLDLQGYSNYQ